MLAFAAVNALTRRYPSLFRAYNLCYTTSLHPDDVANLPAEDIITTPTGALHQGHVLALAYQLVYSVLVRNRCISHMI